MAFPTVETQNTGNGGDASTTPHTLTLPASYQAGDLLLLGIAFDANTFTLPTGFAQITNTLDDGGNFRLVTAYKVATGSEGSDVSMSFGASVRVRYTFQRISGFSVASAPQAGTTAKGNDTTPDPPSLSPSWGSVDTLWIAFAAVAATASFSGYPASYSGGQSATGSVGPMMGSAYRQNATGTENPGTFTNSSGQWIADTIAVRPTGGGAALTLLGVGA